MKRKRVSSKKALDELALKSGSTVKNKDGQQFNAGKTKAEPKPRLEPAPVPEPKPEPAVSNESVANMVTSDAINELTEKLADIGRANVMMLAEMKAQIAEIKINAVEPPTEWIFDMVRDDKGYLVRIKASAKVPERTIN